MPLPDNAWTRSKCAYKALQYMAAGIPVVADDVGISAAVIGHEQGGLIAEDTSAWTIHPAPLGRGRPATREARRGGARPVARDYSVETWAPTLAEILRGTR